MSVIVKGGGGKSSGLYVWKKYKNIPCLSFIGNEDFTLKIANNITNWNGTLEYSTDTTTWSTWDGTEISSSGNNLYLRGTGNTKISNGMEDSRFVFTGSDLLRISCEGNIENLLDYEIASKGNHPNMDESCYQYIFCYCTSLIAAPELQATTLTNNCYQNMFEGCTSLATAPELPATTLANNCYENMFYDCTSLIIAPNLPATILAAYCYDEMFCGCTSLTTVPELPATTLAKYCYYSMFYGCTSLTTAPALPATTLANSCYSNMFSGCTSLTTALALPATTLADRCYFNMFRGCINIKLSTTQTGEYQTAYRIPTSGTGATATNALVDMFKGTGGTFTGAPSINTTYYTSNTVV